MANRNRLQYIDILMYKFAFTLISWPANFLPFMMKPEGSLTL